MYFAKISSFDQPLISFASMAAHVYIYIYTYILTSKNSIFLLVHQMHACIFQIILFEFECTKNTHKKNIYYISETPTSFLFEFVLKWSFVFYCK